jgi:CMP-N-acetylneuraminic acid synthetase
MWMEFFRNTDSEKYAGIAQQYGAKVPFLRDASAPACNGALYFEGYIQ